MYMACTCIHTYTHTHANTHTGKYDAYAALQTQTPSLTQ